MNFTKIESINQLKMADKVAIANYSLEEASVSSNMNLLIGNVCSIVRDSNNEVISVDITTMNAAYREIKLTDTALKLKSVYVITENKEQTNNETVVKKNNERLVKSNIEYNKKLRKAEKLNKKYRAMLVKRFGASEEEIDRNFNNKQKKKDKFITYREQKDTIPMFDKDKIVYCNCKFIFSRNKKNHIRCTIEVYNNLNTYCICEASSIAKCHEEDTFNLKIGEYISSTKAIAKITCMMY